MRRLKALLGATAFLLAFAMIPTANAQVSITIGGPPPVCPYGYYDYAPYACVPMGYYGPGYFYNGIFLGVGPWAYWGYRHGWGSYRFRGPGGGRYYPHGGYHSYSPGHYPPHHSGYRPPPNHGGPPHHNSGYRPPPNHGGGHGGDHGGGHGGDHGGGHGGDHGGGNHGGHDGGGGGHH